MANSLQTHTNQPNQQPNQQSNQQPNQQHYQRWGLQPMADELRPLEQQDITRIYPPKTLPPELMGTFMLHPDRFMPPLGTFYIVTSKKCQLPGGIENGKRCRGCYSDPTLCSVSCQNVCPVCQAGPHIVQGKGQLVSSLSIHRTDSSLTNFSVALPATLPHCVGLELKQLQRRSKCRACLFAGVPDHQAVPGSAAVRLHRQKG
jgi:hypothetical protein